MSFDRVGTVGAKERSVASPKEWAAEEWDAARVLEFGIGQGALGKQQEPGSAVERAVQGMHWISIVCFMEQLNHADLLLLPDVAIRVSAEVAQLRGYDPLEAYAAGLVHLCAGEQTDEGQGAVSAEESFGAED
jgi:hypothetical protein